MAEMIAVVGESGSGKSTSIRNLNPKETFIISTTGKRPGIKGAVKKYPTFTKDKDGYTGNFVTTANVDKIDQILRYINTKRPDIKVVVIDDYQYVMAFEAMDRASDKGFDKFTQMAQHAYQVLKSAMNMRDDLYVVVATHSENTGDRINPYYKMKTLGKMLDNTITLEGLFTYVLFTAILRDDDGNPTYKFMTNSDSSTTGKSPMGLFNELYIDNDLKLVIDRIEEYNSEE